MRRLKQSAKYAGAWLFLQGILAIAGVAAVMWFVMRPLIVRDQAEWERLRKLTKRW